MTLKYLRDLTEESLKGIYEHNNYWQMKWFKLYEYNHEHGIKDSFVVKQFDMYTKYVNKIEKVMKEKGMVI